LDYTTELRECRAAQQARQWTKKVAVFVQMWCSFRVGAVLPSRNTAQREHAAHRSTYAGVFLRMVG
jgi:hypothetical protein